MGDFQNHARFMEPYSINFGWIIRTSTRTSALLVVGWGNHTIFTFSSCVFSQPDQPNIKRWVPSKFKTLERADRFFWEFYFLVLTHQCWRIARSLNDLGVPPNSTDLQLGLLKLGHSHSWLIFWSESCWLMVALISNHKVGRFNLAIPKRRISIILNHGLGDYINGWENTAWTLFFLNGSGKHPIFWGFWGYHTPFFVFVLSIHLTTPVKKNAALALNMEPHRRICLCPGQTWFSQSPTGGGSDQRFGEERLTLKENDHNDRCQLLPHQMVELVYLSLWLW
jgi:hypothetical protein